MKNKLQTLFCFLLLLFSCNVSFSQTNNYMLQFKSGDILISENIENYNPNGTYTFNGYNYLILQFHKLPSFVEREQLTNQGVTLIDYIPNLSYTARVPLSIDKTILQNNGVRAFYAMTEVQKMDMNTFNEIIPDWAKAEKNEVKIEVILIDNFSLQDIMPSLEGVQATIVLEQKEYKMLSLQLPQSNLKSLAAEPWLMWMGYAPEPPKEEGYDDKNTHRSNIINYGVRNLTGKGVKIGVWDAGKATKHIDFGHRLTQVQGTSDHYHACHVSGILVGRGLRNPKGIGMAPDALLYSYDYGGTVTSEVQYAITNYGLVISSNSYGGSPTCTGDPYSATSRSQDLLVNTNPQLIFAFSSGNSQSSCSGGFNTLTGKTSKNTFTVGAVSDKDGSTNYSSYGPTKDMRIKPEIVSVGSSVMSTYLDNQYSLNTGTSMACPGVAGVSAQLIQAYRQANSNTNPKTSLIKAIMCNTARDLGNAGPDYKFGFGRINALRAVKAIEDTRYVVDNVTTGATKDKTITIPSGTTILKVMVCWNDPAATANAAAALINDINLEVIDPSTNSWKPWVLDGTSPSSVAVRAIDSINNMEQVTITNPPAGTYILRVKGQAITTGANQEYALTWLAESPFIEVTFPCGGEMLEPGSAAILQWDNEGITSSQKIEYSLNAGSTWTTITSSVAAASNNYTWAVPNTFTSQAQIRISSGSINDVSDKNFTIIDFPATLTASDDSCGVDLTWTAVANATGYDVMLLDTINGVWNVVGNNVSGINYVIGGLSVGVRYWFTVRARNNSQNIIGERAIAINRTNTNSGIVAPTITVNGNILSTQTAATYQWMLNGIIIPGATSQNYTVPYGGNYSVLVTNSSGCNAASSPVFMSLISIDENNNAILYTVYPNPSNGIFDVEINGTNEKSKLIITNALGELVNSFNFDTSSLHTKIDISKYGIGIYFITFINEHISQTKKIIIY